MKKKVLAGFYAFLVSVLLTTSALAGAAIKLSSVTFTLGSLVAKGTLSGLGKTDTIRVALVASGRADITCINLGGTAVPGQSSPRLTAIGHQNLTGINDLPKNGKTPFAVETGQPLPVVWYEAGCQNSNWIGYVDFIYWDEATLTVQDIATDTVLLEQKYTCTTTRFPAFVSCTAVP
jgi:hypothetical protein